MNIFQLTQEFLIEICLQSKYMGDFYNLQGKQEPLIQIILHEACEAHLKPNTAIAGVSGGK